MDPRLVILSMSLWIQGLLGENNITLTDSFHFRLVGGASRCHGDMEMKREDEDWTPVDGLNWYRELGNTVCVKLGCGSAVSMRSRKRNSFIFSWSLAPTCEDPRLSDCFRSSSFHNSFLELNCSDSVRLVHGSSMCSGRLEVRSDQSRSWSSVCEGKLDLHDAQVVCRELGCGPPGLLQGALYGEVEAPLWKTFRCEGYESALLDCGSSVSDTCSSGRAVDLTCTDPGDVRLVGGASRCNGKVQIKHGEWRDMGYFYDVWTLKAADVICRHLDCGSAVSVRSADSSHPTWFLNTNCLLSTPTLMDCVRTDTYTMGTTLFLNCSDSVRLVHGSSLCSGRLEVRFDQSWSSVCEEDLDLNDTQVICRELGCGAPSLLQGGLYGDGEAPVWTTELHCEGTESAILGCRRSSFAGKTCTPRTAAGLTCTGGMKLVGQPSRCAGTLEIQHQGEWKPAVVRYGSWDLKTGSAVCQHLDCGSVVLLNNTVASSSRPVWSVFAYCVKETSGLRDCVELGKDNSGPSAVDMVCSDLVPQPIISLSVSADGVSEVYQRGFRLLIGCDFTITCSIQPQYPGGSFQLISNSKEPLNRTLPAVNHSAHFLLSAVGRAFRGDYRCVYHVDVFNHSFSSSQSPALFLTVADSVTHLIIRVVLLVLALLIVDGSLFFFYKVSVRRIRMWADG